MTLRLGLIHIIGRCKSCLCRKKLLQQIFKNLTNNKISPKKNNGTIPVQLVLDRYEYVRLVTFPNTYCSYTRQKTSGVN